MAAVTEPLITKRNYGRYVSSNYGAHTLEISFGNLTVYFSCDTAVAFRRPGVFQCCENVWGPTTAKHLNWLEPDKSKRLHFNEFMDNLEAVLTEYKLL